MVRRCLCCRVRAVGRIRRGFCKRRIVRAQCPVYLIGRDMQEAECRAFCFRQCLPMGAHGFQQAEGTIDIGADEFCWSMNRTIDMALRREMHDGAWLMLCQ